MSSDDTYREISNRRHALHVWINRRQDERGRGQEWEGSLYAWKDMEAERERFPRILKAAFERTLPTVYQYCSQTDPEPIFENRLVCALGQEVTTCPILLSLRATFAEQREQRRRIEERQVNDQSGLTDDSAYQAMATVCTWHIFTTTFAVRLGHPQHDLSEGWAKDESDRRFWAKTYELMAMEPDEIGGSDV